MADILTYHSKKHGKSTGDTDNTYSGSVQFKCTRKPSQRIIMHYIRVMEQQNLNCMSWSLWWIYLLSIIYFPPMDWQNIIGHGVILLYFYHWSAPFSWICFRETKTLFTPFYQAIKCFSLHMESQGLNLVWCTEVHERHWGPLQLSHYCICNIFTCTGRYI